MISLFGLGNPGSKYSKTKHNAGFWVVDELSQRWKVSFKPGIGDYVFATHERKKALLVKPTIGMNLSGIAVKDVTRKWDLLPKDICVIFDDVDLPLGSIRIRPKGGDGCHRGIENIIYQLKSEDFPRIRFGIGTDENMRPAEKFVLKPFRSSNEAEAKTMISYCADAIENFLINGINHTMNHFNS